MSERLPEDQIVAALAGVPQWQRRGDEIARTFDRGNFDGSMAFLNAVAVAANAADHHPEMTLSWNEVTLTLSTHSAGGLTAKDFALAATIDELA